MATIAKDARRSARTLTPESARLDPGQRSSYPKAFAFWALLGLVAVLAAYSNHFQNSFHFDDSHAIISNVYLRDLRNVPRFFTDGTTFSSLPANQSWRPLLSTSLAVDYRLGNGLKPFWFHLSTFCWFLLEIISISYVCRRVLDAASPSPANAYISLFAALWYGLHPANAETINYIIQRGDVYATLGVVAGLALYIRFPDLRKFGVYLIPVILGALSKPPAVVFCGILFLYIFLFEEDADTRRLGSVLVRALPALVVCIALAVLNVKLTPKSFTPTTLPAAMYWVTQPWVVVRYIRSFFLPLWLSADTDLRPFSSLFHPKALSGVVVCLVLAAVAVWAAKKQEHRPICFGLAWFFLALLPTSVVVLSEVENDHRMFFPLVGLGLAVTWAAVLLLSRAPAEHRSYLIPAAQVLAVGLLLACALGTWKRNEVWRSEESLWRDVTIKSPENGRGLMNYGLTLMGKGDTPAALQYFQRAAVFTPNYYVLEINTGIALGLLQRADESERHFRRAITLAPQDAQPYYYYGRWLKSRARTTEATEIEKAAIARNPAFMDARYLLMQIYLEQRQWNDLRQLAQDTLMLAPQDATAQTYFAHSQNPPDELAGALSLAQQQPTPEHYLNLSLLYHRAGRYQDCINAAQQALRLRPNYAEAYNNIAAAYQSMGQWDPAIAAARRAVELKPDFQLARNNLAYSEAQKRIKSR